MTDSTAMAPNQYLVVLLILTCTFCSGAAPCIHVDGSAKNIKACECTHISVPDTTHTCETDAYCFATGRNKNNPCVTSPKCMHRQHNHSSKHHCIVCLSTDERVCSKCDKNSYFRQGRCLELELGELEPNQLRNLLDVDDRYSMIEKACMQNLTLAQNSLDAQRDTTETMQNNFSILAGVVIFQSFVLLGCCIACKRKKKTKTTNTTSSTASQTDPVKPVVTTIGRIRNRFANLVQKAHSEHINMEAAMSVMDDAEAAIKIHASRQDKLRRSSQLRLSMRLKARSKGPNIALLATAFKKKTKKTEESGSSGNNDDDDHDAGGSVKKKDKKAKKSKKDKKKKDKKKKDKKVKKVNLKNLKKTKVKVKFKLPHTAVLGGVDFEVVARIGMRNIGLKKLTSMFKQNPPKNNVNQIFLNPIKTILTKFKVPEAEWMVVMKHMGAMNPDASDDDTMDDEIIVVDDETDMILEKQKLFQWMEQGDKVEHARSMLRDFVPPAIIQRLFQIDKNSPGKAKRNLMEKVMPKLGIPDDELPLLFSALGLKDGESEISIDEFLQWVNSKNSV